MVSSNAHSTGPFKRSTWIVERTVDPKGVYTHCMEVVKVIDDALPVPTQVVSRRPIGSVFQIIAKISIGKSIYEWKVHDCTVPLEVICPKRQMNGGRKTTFCRDSCDGDGVSINILQWN